MNQPPIVFDRGILTISLDFELIWGTLDLPHYRRFVPLCTVEREEIVGRLVDLFAEFEISATWCTVGHLFLDHCGDTCGKHPGRGHTPSSDSRFSRDPGTSENEDPVFYGRKLVELIRACPVPQEIGSHTFSHLMFGDPACSRAAAKNDLAAAVEAAGEMGLQLRSFAFPRNRIGHTDLLRESGFTCYRSRDAIWYDRAPTRRWYHRAAHLADILTVGTPPAVLPEWDPHGIWTIPGSMLYTPSYGVRKLIPVGFRVARARKGLRAAARERKIFHLWLHPTDLVVRRNAMLNGLCRIFETAAEMRSRGKLDVLPMGEIALRLPSAAGMQDSLSQEIGHAAAAQGTIAQGTMRIAGA